MDYSIEKAKIKDFYCTYGNPLKKKDPGFETKINLEISFNKTIVKYYIFLRYKKRKNAEKTWEVIGLIHKEFYCPICQIDEADIPCLEINKENFKQSQALTNKIIHHKMIRIPLSFKIAENQKHILS